MGYVLADITGIGGNDDDYAKTAREAEKARQAKIDSGRMAIDKAFAGFDNNFYNQRSQSYVNYAMPQLAQQYRQNLSQVNYDMGNRGLLGGSAQRQQLSELNRENAQAKQGIVDSGIAQAQQLRQQVEQAKNQQLSNLYSSADPAGAGANAISTAAGFTQPSVYPALANQFQNIANAYYLSQLVNTYRSSAGGTISSPDSFSNTGAASLGPTLVSPNNQ